MGKTVEVPDYEIREHVEVDPDRTALVIVDMQNDFVRTDGKLPVPTAEATIPAIARLRRFAREHDMLVCYTQDSHYDGDPEFALWGEHVVVGTPGWQIVEELAPDPAAGDLVFRKDRYDGFYGTRLDQELKAREIDTVIVCGTVANICVLSTASSAAIRWYKVVLPVDAISALCDFDMELALRQVSFLFQGQLTRSDGLVAKKGAAQAAQAD